jgi:hypothetical protein
LAHVLEQGTLSVAEPSRSWVCCTPSECMGFQHGYSDTIADTRRSTERARYPRHHRFRSMLQISPASKACAARVQVNLTLSAPAAASGHKRLQPPCARRATLPAAPPAWNMPDRRLPIKQGAPQDRLHPNPSRRLSKEITRRCDASRRRGGVP